LQAGFFYNTCFERAKSQAIIGDNKRNYFVHEKYHPMPGRGKSVQQGGRRRIGGSNCRQPVQTARPPDSSLLNPMKPNVTARNLPLFSRRAGRLAVFWLLSICCWAANLRLAAAETETNATAMVEGRAGLRFKVTAYDVEGSTLISSDDLARLFSKYTGPNVELEDVVNAAADLHWEFYKRGHPLMSVALAKERITNGIVTLNVFQTAIPQVVVSGDCCLLLTNNPPAVPATPAEMAEAHAVLARRIADLNAEEQTAELKASDTRVHVVSTNAGPRFAVDKYLVGGNSVLAPNAVAMALTNIDGAFGTNVSFDGIITAATELQRAYRERGYMTVAVTVPPQKLTNATVKLAVTEGRLVVIEVKGNHYFSSNNIMRALPSLQTNIILNGPVFQAELNRANANQDRQIYPLIEPGPSPGTSALALKVKDQLPLHGKLELNNESSPGTPEMRVNSSAVYNNLWQLDHSLGVQYGFSPQNYKTGRQWDFYDQPLVANYSAFYRMPLGNPEAIEDVVANKPGSFGYNEATRKFNLPPPSGQPELNVFASRSTIDTGLQTLSSSVLYNVPGVRTITQDTVQQDLTITSDAGARLSTPLNATSDFRSDVSGGADYKTYRNTSYKTNNFTFAEITVNAAGVPNPPVYSTVVSPVPVTDRSLDYAPLSLAYNASWRTASGTLAGGLGISGNTWYSGSLKNLRAIAGSARSTGHWVTLAPSLSWQFSVYTNWQTTLRADGQWASEPLISNEQFGAGGVNSVRGYQEGQVFGDTGWHMSLEQLTPPHVVGIAYGNTPLILRGTVYMDYADTCLLDPQGRPASTALWGAGFGGVASIGSHWETRFLFSLPLLGTSTTTAYQPFFNFALTAQF
jgi:hemolysin activation/secretion protein